MDAELKILQAQQKVLSEDMTEIKGSLKAIASSLSSLAVLEQKHHEAREGIARAHKRIEAIETSTKEDFKIHEKRIQNLELYDAKNLWVERIVWVIVAVGISVFSQGIL